MTPFPVSRTPFPVFPPAVSGFPGPNSKNTRQLNSPASNSFGSTHAIGEDEKKNDPVHLLVSKLPTNSSHKPVSRKTGIVKWEEIEAALR
jgi:hypothetical protein